MSHFPLCFLASHFLIQLSYYKNQSVTFITSFGRWSYKLDEPTHPCNKKRWEHFWLHPHFRGTAVGASRRGGVKEETTDLQPVLPWLFSLFSIPYSSQPLEDTPALCIPSHHGQTYLKLHWGGCSSLWPFPELSMVMLGWNSKGQKQQSHSWVTFSDLHSSSASAPSHHWNADSLLIWDCHK